MFLEPSLRNWCGQKFTGVWVADYFWSEGLLLGWGNQSFGMVWDVLTDMIWYWPESVSEQNTLLKLREQALKEKTQAELAWLEQQKQRMRHKGADDAYPQIKKRQRGLIMRLQQEQVSIKQVLQSGLAPPLPLPSQCEVKLHVEPCTLFFQNVSNSLPVNRSHVIVKMESMRLRWAVSCEIFFILMYLWKLSPKATVVSGDWAIVAPKS